MRNVLLWNDWFPNEWERLYTQRKILMVDSCSAGEFIEQLRFDPSPHVSLAHCSAGEVAWAGIPEEGLPIIGSVWNYYFTNALCNSTADSDENGFVSVEEAFNFSTPLTQRYMNETVFAVPEFLESYHDIGIYPENYDAYPNPVMDDQYPEQLHLNLRYYGSNVALLVQNQQYSILRSHLEQYVEDVAKMSGFNVVIVNGSWINHVEVRETLQDLHENLSIVGCLLVGEIPWAYYNASSGYGEAPFPTDLYYMDLNGQWVDENSDEIFDNRTDPDGVEIWVSRIRPPIDDNNLLVSFFEKDHNYRIGTLDVPKTCLMFQENNGQDWGEIRIEALKPLYDREEITLFCLSNETSKENYVSALKNPYELVWINAHGGPTRQLIVQPNGESVWFDCNDAKNVEKGGIFHLVHSCESGPFDTTNYLSGWHLFGEGYTLGCLASATVWESIDHDLFIEETSRSYVGKAFLSIIQVADSKAKYDPITARNLYYGATLQGDPLLFLGRSMPLFLVTDVNSDGTVNILDIAIVAKAYGTEPGDDNWNETADLDDNNKIDILDIATVAKDYGKTV